MNRSTNFKFTDDVENLSSVTLYSADVCKEKLEAFTGKHYNFQEDRLLEIPKNIFNQTYKNAEIITNDVIMIITKDGSYTRPYLIPNLFIKSFEL